MRSDSRHAIEQALESGSLPGAVARRYGVARGVVASIDSDRGTAFASQIRFILEAERHRGVEFPAAWRNALLSVAPPKAWSQRVDSSDEPGEVNLPDAEAQDGVTPLSFMRAMFAKAYAGIAPHGDIVPPDDDPPPFVTGRQRRSTGNTHGERLAIAV